MSRSFTGRHLAMIMVTGFGIVIAVNLTMAWLASSTFSGTQVANSYVASQNFNHWLAEAERVRALGWEVTPERRADGFVELHLKDVPTPVVAQATARHPLGQDADHDFAFVQAQSAPSDDADTIRLISTRPLPSGRWIMRIELKAGGELWRGEETFR